MLSLNKMQGLGSMTETKGLQNKLPGIDFCTGACHPRSHWNTSLARRNTFLILLVCSEKNGVQWFGLNKEEVSQIQQEIKIRRGGGEEIHLPGRLERREQHHP